MLQREVTSVTSRTQHVAVAPRLGTMLWILQRLSAYGLLFFLAVHLYFVYFARVDVSSALTAAAARQPFQSFPTGFVINEALLLICALFHGLNGVRNIIYDWTTNTGLRRSINAILIAVGMLAAFYGIVTLWHLA